MMKHMPEYCFYLLRIKFPFVKNKSNGLEAMSLLPISATEKEIWTRK